MNNFIYHVTTQANWLAAVEVGYYTHPSLVDEGFIHCSKAHQVEGVLQRYFKDIPNLVQLTINTQKLTVPLQYDFSASVNEEFPHLYGTLNIDAVEFVESINTPS